VGNWFHRTEDIDFANHPEASGSQSVSKGALYIASQINQRNKLVVYWETLTISAWFTLSIFLTEIWLFH
jgi:hypothetical protein